MRKHDRQWREKVERKIVAKRNLARGFHGFMSRVYMARSAAVAAANLRKAKRDAVFRFSAVDEASKALRKLAIATSTIKIYSGFAKDLKAINEHRKKSIQEVDSSVICQKLS